MISFYILGAIKLKSHE